MSPLYYQKSTLCAAGKEDGFLQFNSRAYAKPDLGQ
jgi:hypothetical protein